PTSAPAIIRRRSGAWSTASYRRGSKSGLSSGYDLRAEENSCRAAAVSPAPWSLLRPHRRARFSSVVILTDERKLPNTCEPQPRIQLTMSAPSVFGLDLSHLQTWSVPIIGLTSTGLALLIGGVLLRWRRSSPRLKQTALAVPDPFTHGSATEKRASFRRM